MAYFHHHRPHSHHTYHYPHYVYSPPVTHVTTYPPYTYNSSSCYHHGRHYTPACGGKAVLCTLLFVGIISALAISLPIAFL